MDTHANVPRGTTSFYFRTRQALLQAVAERLTELDVADLSLLEELTDSGPAQFSGTAGLARIVMYSTNDPWLTRAKARYELLLQSNRDSDLAATLHLALGRFYDLSRDVVTRWQPAGVAADPALLDEQAIAVITLIDGVLLSFVAGWPAVRDAEQLDAMIRGLLCGLAADRSGREVTA